jgi:hypothetical protein
MQRYEFAGSAELVLDAGQQMRFPMPGTRGAKQDAAAGFLERHREDVGQDFECLTIDRFRMGGGNSTKSFEKKLERMIVGHRDFDSTRREFADLFRISQDQREENQSTRKITLFGKSLAFPSDSAFFRP